MTTAFWVLAGLIVYIYAGYPLSLALLRRVRGTRSVAVADIEPPVTLIISAFNEEAVIEEKIRNSLALDYPKDRLQIIVVSDASDDRTDAIVLSFAEQGVELLRMPQRSGKTLGLNAAVERAYGEVIVFSDANALYEPQALRALVRNFADPTVGAAVGESRYFTGEQASQRSEGSYWRYETWIKRMESAIGSVVGGDGAIYAIRKNLYKPMEVDALSDFVNPLQIVLAGYRCVYEPAAVSWEHAGTSFRAEFRRKVRIVNRALRALWRMRALLNPFRYGLFAVELLSHKALRWLVPLFLLGMLGVNAALLGSGIIYDIAFIAQVACYLAACAGCILDGKTELPSVFSIPYYFCLHLQELYARFSADVEFLRCVDRHGDGAHPAEELIVRKHSDQHETESREPVELEAIALRFEVPDRQPSGDQAEERATTARQHERVQHPGHDQDRYPASPVSEPEAQH